MLDFKAISIRTSTERPEAIDYGNIVLGGISAENIINAVNITLVLEERNEAPENYLKPNVSNTVLKLIQSYAPIVNKEIWRK